MKPMRVVLDTNVLVSALLSKKGNPAKIYKMFLSGEIILIINDVIMAEYTDVLYRPRLRIPTNDVSIVLDAIRAYGECIKTNTSAFPMIDEDDRVFYDTAKYYNALLITGNKRHYPNEFFIQNPNEFLKTLI